MDQNRCLLDVIDNPQLLQSFLESEASAENNNNRPPINPNIAIALNNSVTASISATSASTTTFTTYTHPSTTTATLIDSSPANIDKIIYEQPPATSLEKPESLNLRDLPSPPPSQQQQPTSASYCVFSQQKPLQNHNLNEDGDNQGESSSVETKCTSGGSRLTDGLDVDAQFLDTLSNNTSDDFTAFDKSSAITSQQPCRQIANLDQSDVCNTIQNDNSRQIESVEPSKEVEKLDQQSSNDYKETCEPQPSIEPVVINNENHNLTQKDKDEEENEDGLVNDIKEQKKFSKSYSSPENPTDSTPTDQASNNSTYQLLPPQSLSASSDESTYDVPISESASTTVQSQPSTTPMVASIPMEEQKIKQEPIEASETSSSYQTITPSVTTLSTTVSSTYPPPTFTGTAITAPATTTTTATTSTTKPAAPKRAPKKSTPRAPKGKNSKTSNQTNQTSSGTTPTSQPPMQTQFAPQPPQQQMLFQQNNNGIRPTTILATSPMGQTIGGMPQQQRVIQIQTANGPMYFAIAPGPAMNNGPIVNQQLPGMQSQYPSPQVCFQPNSTVMINRTPMTQAAQQQSQQQQQSQTRLSADYVNSNSSTPTSQQSERLGQFTPDPQQTRCLTSPQTVASPQQQQVRMQSPIVQYNGQNNQMQANTIPNQLSPANGLNKNSNMQNQQKFVSQPGPIILQNRAAQGFVNQQQPQQIITSQSNSIMVNGQQMVQSTQNTNQLASPMMANQNLAISNQQSSPQQQQHIVLPSSQPMMMPRMSNQLILNRPLNSPGQLLPGQQQFIQIQTPNGPMLLALPTQPAQPINNTMIDYNNQVQQQQIPISQSQQQVTDKTEACPTTPTKQASSSKTVSNSKSGLDLADLLLDCGILPEERMNSSQSPNSIKTSRSPSMTQINSPIPSMTQINSPMPTMDPSSMSTNQTQQPISNYPGQPIQQQPIRIHIGPDGQMIMQPTVYGAIRPVLTNTMGQAHLNTIAPTNTVPSSSPMMTLTSSPSTPNNNNNETKTDTKKSTAKGKGTATKRSRSKKSDLDKFPILKTPKIAQQQQQQQQQQMQAVTVVPMTVLVDQNKAVLGGPDVKTSVAQLTSGQQVSLAKIVTPVMQTASLQPLGSSNIIRSSIPQANQMLATTTIGQSTSSGPNTQIATESGNSINASGLNVQNSGQVVVGGVTTAASASHISSSGNVTTNLLQRIDKSGTVESNPHISSSLMPTLSLTVDTLKNEPNGLKTFGGQQLKGFQNSAGGFTTTLVLHQTQQHQNSQNQQVARQVDLRAQSILNQLAADQNAALNPQTKQSFRSFEDACKRLLRYHVFDTQTVSESQINKVDEIFDATAESLISRKKAIYDKYRLLILKQSMKIVPSSEEVMLDQIFINDEHSYLKKERELFREYEAQMESLSLKQARAVDSKIDSSKEDYFAFGENSPKQNNQDHDLDGAARSKDVDDWLLNDKWGKSHYPSVPDSEAATAIESILNEELS